MGKLICKRHVGHALQAATPETQMVIPTRFVGVRLGPDWPLWWLSAPSILGP